MLISYTHLNNTALVNFWQPQILEHVDKTERLQKQCDAVSGVPQQKAVTRLFTAGMWNEQLENALK